MDQSPSPVAAPSLADLRAARGLSRRALATLAGVGESTVRRIEAREGYAPGPAVVRRLCAALGTPERGVAEFRYSRRPLVARSRVWPRARFHSDT